MALPLQGSVLNLTNSKKKIVILNKTNFACDIFVPKYIPMKILFATFFALLTFFSSQQSFANDSLSVAPYYTGGIAQLASDIQSDIVYPALAIRKSIAGTAKLTLILNADGSIKTVHSLEELGGGCDAEAIRIIKKQSFLPPGEEMEFIVEVEFVLPE